MIQYKGHQLLCEITNNIKPFIPVTLREVVMQNFHGLDHCGQKEAQHRVSKCYFWPKLKRDVGQFVKSCHPCQSVKGTLKIKPKARIFNVPQERFAELHTDIVGPLPPSEGMKYILTILDRRTRWLECVALPAATSLNVCNGFIRAWLARYGAPSRIFCDNGNTYVANLWQDLNRVLGIQVQFVPLYHQSTNGAIERQHRTLKESIKASLIEMGDVHRENWMSQLPLTLLGRRVALQPDLGVSSADLVMGGAPVLPGILVPDTPESKNKNDQELLYDLRKNAAKPATPMSKHSKPDEVVETEDFKKATHVYVRVDKPDNLGQRFQGPFQIRSRPSNTTIVISVGLTKGGQERLECHHWSNCRPASMRPGAPLGRRPELGRPPNQNNVKSNMAAEDATFLAPNLNRQQQKQTVEVAQQHQLPVTQPRFTPVGNDFQTSAETADSGYFDPPPPTKR